MDHEECLINGLMAALESGRHTDITIEVEDKTFQCHKVILEAVSPYFRSMFLVGIPESTQGNFQIPNLTKKGFEGALCYIYSGKPDLNKDIVLDILQASSVLQIEGLRELCEEMLLKDVLNFDSCIHLWQIAESNDCLLLLGAAKKMARESFDEVIKKTVASQFTTDQLVLLFQDFYLKVTSEVTLLSLALLWAQESGSNIPEINRVFGAIHLDLITDDEWKLAVDTHCKTISQDLLMCLQSLWKLSKIKSPSEKAQSIRLFYQKEKVLVYFNEYGSIDCYVLSESFHNTSESLHFPPIVSVFEDVCCVRCCVHEEELYVECLVDRTSKFMKMCAKTGQWIQYAARGYDDMFSSCVLISCNNCIFAVQGRKLINEDNTVSTSAKIQRYTFEENSWKTVCILPDVIQEPLVVLASCFLCIYNRSDLLTSVFTYNYKSDIFKEMGQLPSYVPKPDFVIAKGRNRFLFSKREVTRLKNILDEPYTLDVFDELGKYTRQNLRFNGIMECGKTVYCISSQDDEHYVLWEFNTEKLCLRKPRPIHSIQKWSTGVVVEIKRRFLMN